MLIPFSELPDPDRTMSSQKREREISSRKNKALRGWEIRFLSQHRRTKQKALNFHSIYAYLSVWVDERWPTTKITSTRTRQVSKSEENANHLGCWIKKQRKEAKRFESPYQHIIIMSMNNVFHFLFLVSHFS